MINFLDEWFVYIWFMMIPTALLIAIIVATIIKVLQKNNRKVQND